MIDKQQIAQQFNVLAPHRPAWFRRNFTYHEQIIRACKPFLFAKARVLELGCSTGDLLHALKPGYGVGVDISQVSIDIARAKYPDLEWVCADVEALPDSTPFDAPYDVIVMADLMGYISDIQAMLHAINRLCHSRTRLVIA